MDDIPPELDHYKADDLFLLVGGNPLPNAVAGRTLLKEGGRIVPVYSDQTNDVRRNLTAWLKDTLKYHNKGATVGEPVNVKPADASSIYVKLKAAIGGDVRSRTVGLHYTGGKKSMAVHAYRAIADAVETPVMSYLEASTLTFHFDPPDPERPGGGKAVHVGDAVKLRVRDLIDLHGWSLSRGEPATESVLSNTVRALMTEVYAEGHEQQWQEWVNRCFNVEQHVDLPGGPHLQKIAQTLKEDLPSATVDGKLDMAKAARENGFKSKGAFADWLRGSWLEPAVMDVLKEVREDCKLNDELCRSFHVEPARGENVEFEFDATALRGYQLFAFSCTVTGGNISNSKLKTKLFELYVRARQFGGTEARMALVCMVEKPHIFQRQIQRDIWADEIDKQRLRVFGRPHMKNLSGAISRWIKSQSNTP